MQSSSRAMKALVFKFYLLFFCCCCCGKAFQIYKIWVTKVGDSAIDFSVLCLKREKCTRSCIMGERDQSPWTVRAVQASEGTMHSDLHEPAGTTGSCVNETNRAPPQAPDRTSVTLSKNQGSYAGLKSMEESRISMRGTKKTANRMTFHLVP